VTFLKDRAVLIMGGQTLISTKHSVSVNYQKKSSSLTLFFNEVMVSSYYILIQWFLKTLPKTARGFRKPLSE
jgi:hypothetical protein